MSVARPFACVNSCVQAGVVVGQTRMVLVIPHTQLLSFPARQYVSNASHRAEIFASGYVGWISA